MPFEDISEKQNSSNLSENNSCEINSSIVKINSSSDQKEQLFNIKDKILKITNENPSTLFEKIQLELHHGRGFSKDIVISLHPDYQKKIDTTPNDRLLFSFLKEYNTALSKKNTEVSSPILALTNISHNEKLENPIK